MDTRAGSGFASNFVYMCVCVRVCVCACVCVCVRTMSERISPRTLSAPTLMSSVFDDDGLV